MKTRPKANPPVTSASAVASGTWDSNRCPPDEAATRTPQPPKSIESMILQEPTRVTISTKAPKRQANVDVSPIDPGIVPRNASDQLTWIARIPCATSATAKAPSGVAPLKPSTAVQTRSPVMSAG